MATEINLPSTSATEQNSCKVWLDNYQSHYEPGSDITGKVIVHNNKTMLIKNIIIKLSCLEQTEWMIEDSYEDKRTNEVGVREVLMQGYHEIYKEQTLLYGIDIGDDLVPLQNGEQHFPFYLTLSMDIPSSFSCRFGTVKYMLTATVNCPNPSNNMGDETTFVVRNRVNLNKLPDPLSLLLPAYFIEHKHVPCLLCCCLGGNVILNVDVPKMELVPRESITIDATIRNASKADTYGITFELKQVIQCSVDQPKEEHKIIENVLVQKDGPAVPSHNYRSYNFLVKLPDNVVIPNFTHCKLFQIKHEYKFVVKLPERVKDLELIVNPMIGHIAVGQTRPPRRRVTSTDASPQQFPFSDEIDLFTPHPLSLHAVRPSCWTLPARTATMAVPEILIIPPPADSPTPPGGAGEETKAEEPQPSAEIEMNEGIHMIEEIRIDI